MIYHTLQQLLYYKIHTWAVKICHTRHKRKAYQFTKKKLFIKSYWNLRRRFARELDFENAALVHKTSPQIETQQKKK